MRLASVAMPTVCSHSASGPASAASPTMPLRMAIEVMPTWMVDKKRVGFVVQFHRRRCRRAAIFGQPRQACAPRHHQRDFRHGEHAIQHDQCGQQQDFHGVIRSEKRGGAAASWAA
jgi:hypothetical protein